MPSFSLKDAIVLARPKQWVKSVFVVVGPAYGMADKGVDRAALLALAGAVVAFSLCSSACYILNDLRDVEADRLHPRKRNRPLAAGRIAPGQARFIAAVLAALGLLGLIPVFLFSQRAGLLTTGCVLGYIANVVLYSGYFKQRPVVDVMSLAGGFVLRVLGGCAATLVEPSVWLLNCTLFISMFLALGKRLGERRVMGEAAADVRGVQRLYSGEILRMLVAITAVACLLSYADYVQDRGAAFTHGFNLLWLTLLPATFALLRATLLLEAGAYDDPTELATRDRQFQAGVLVFVALTGALVYLKATGRLAGPEAAEEAGEAEISTANLAIAG